MPTPKKKEEATPTPPNKAKDETSQGNLAASGTGPTQAVMTEGSDPTTPGAHANVAAGNDDGNTDDKFVGTSSGGTSVEATTQVVSDTSNDDANPKNDPSDDKVNKELAQRKQDRTPVGDDPNNDDPPVVQDNGVDLFAASDTGPNRQGNAYGMSWDAIENFRRDLEAEREEAYRRIEAIDDELDALDNKEVQEQ